MLYVGKKQKTKHNANISELMDGFPEATYPYIEAHVNNNQRYYKAAATTSTTIMDSFVTSTNV